MKQPGQIVEETPELKAIYEQLKLKYPTHHWNHVNAFTSFWTMVETCYN